MSSLPKPILRGHIARRGVKTVIGAVIFAAISGAAYHFIVGVPRKHAYENFLQTYDPEAHYKDLAKWGYFQCTEKIKGSS